MTISRNILPPRYTWPAQDLTLLAALYPYTPNAALQKLFKVKPNSLQRAAKKMGLHKSPWYYNNNPASGTFKFNGHQNINTQFKKGFTPYNKNKKGMACHPNTIATQFKKGSSPVNLQPIGHTRIDVKDKYQLIKMHEGRRNYYALHRVIWARMHGPIPSNCAVTFFDGNRLNCSITNLTLLTKKQVILNNSIHHYGKEIAHLSLLRAQISRQINKRAQHEQQY